MSKRLTAGSGAESESDADALLRIDPTAFETLTTSPDPTDSPRIVRWLETWSTGN